MNKFIKKNTFYRILPTWEFNLPAGHSCPFANECKICVDEVTGKFLTIGTSFRCYAASSERFPAVRKARWNNYRAMLNKETINVPVEATRIRIHASGDFFSQEYFDKWLEVCLQNKNKHFWAFTKSIQYWVNRIKDIPSNLILTASYGSKQDYLINEYNLKYTKVFNTLVEARASGLPIDTDDWYAMQGQKSFALLDNNKFNKKNKVINE